MSSSPTQNFAHIGDNDEEQYTLLWPILLQRNILKPAFSNLRTLGFLLGLRNLTYRIALTFFSRCPQPEAEPRPVEKQDAEEVQAPNAPPIGTPTPSRMASKVEPSIVAPDAITKVAKPASVPPISAVLDTPPIATTTTTMISSAPTFKSVQPDQKTPPVVEPVPSPLSAQSPVLPSPAKLDPISEIPKPAGELLAPVVSMGPPLVAPMQPLGTAPIMSVTSMSSVPGGILKQSKPATIVYKDDLFQDNER